MSIHTSLATCAYLICMALASGHKWVSTTSLGGQVSSEHHLHESECGLGCVGRQSLHWPRPAIKIEIVCTYVNLNTAW